MDIIKRGRNILNERQLDRGQWDDSIYSIDVDAKDIKKVKELAKAADTLGLDYILWTIGNWEAEGDAIFGTVILTLKGRTLYVKDEMDRNKLVKAAPEGYGAKIQFSLYKTR